MRNHSGVNGASSSSSNKQTTSHGNRSANDDKMHLGNGAYSVNGNKASSGNTIPHERKYNTNTRLSIYSHPDASIQRQTANGIARVNMNIEMNCSPKANSPSNVNNNSESNNSNISPEFSVNPRISASAISVENYAQGHAPDTNARKPKTLTRARTFIASPSFRRAGPRFHRMSCPTGGVAKALQAVWLLACLKRNGSHESDGEDHEEGGSGNGHDREGGEEGVDEGEVGGESGGDEQGGGLILGGPCLGHMENVMANGEVGAKGGMEGWAGGQVREMGGMLGVPLDGPVSFVSLVSTTALFFFGGGEGAVFLDIVLAGHGDGG